MTALRRRGSGLLQFGQGGTAHRIGAFASGHGRQKMLNHSRALDICLALQLGGGPSTR